MFYDMALLVDEQVSETTCISKSSITATFTLYSPIILSRTIHCPEL